MTFVGVDIGTTSTKAIVCSTSGEIQAIGNCGYPILTPHPTWAEQDPQAIFQAAIAAVRIAVEQAQASPQSILALSFSTAMHTLVAVDAAGNLLTNSLIWADNRATPQVERLKQDGTGHRLYCRTGTPTHPMSPLAKLLWMREAEPEIFRKAAKFISIKEYIFYQLFGVYVVDDSIASATGLYHLTAHDWDADAIALTGIQRQQLSEIVPTTHILRGMKANYATAMGIDPDTPVVIGANDGVLANLGVGAIAADQVAVTLGTSGAVRIMVKAPAIDPQERTFCYALTRDRWVIGGATNSGGGVLRWFRDQFCGLEVAQAQQQGISAYEVMIQAAADVSAGAAGLLFLPFLSGERAPHWNANARGVFFGMGLHHQRAHLIRAVLEGILLSVYSVHRVLEQLTPTAQAIRAAGGFARSPIWRQMMADVFGYEVLVPTVYEASGFGAIALAMLALGVISDLSDVQSLIQIRDRHQPNLHLRAQYAELFAIYEKLYDHVVEDFNALATYQHQLDEKNKLL